MSQADPQRRIVLPGISTLALAVAVVGAIHPTAQPYFTVSRTMRSESIVSQDGKLSLSLYRHVMYESIGRETSADNE